MFSREVGNIKGDIGTMQRHNEMPTPSPGEIKFVQTWGITGGVFAEQSPPFTTPFPCSLATVEAVLGEGDTSGIQIDALKNGQTVISFVTGTGNQYREHASTPVPCHPLLDRVILKVRSDGDGVGVDLTLMAIFT